MLNVGSHGVINYAGIVDFGMSLMKVISKMNHSQSVERNPILINTITQTI